ncbi:hypothetical protein HYY70_03045 [Candidatus Woesearchaeota archaeon]|nr:hypothetical protein [Candidatus Woesearchaeota archaeon]
MRKTVFFLFLLLILAVGCKPEEEPKKEPFCGDNVCQPNEKESGCKADCGGLEGITAEQCSKAGGHWNECGSACSGTGAEICIQVCVPQCECGGIAGFRCPHGFRCKLSGRFTDEIGVCVKDG